MERMAGRELTELPYSYGVLEPYMDEQIMRLHYDKHHATYVANRNAALEKYPEADKGGVGEILASMDEIPEEIRVAVRNSSGGYAKNSLFWRIIADRSLTSTRFLSRMAEVTLMKKVDPQVPNTTVSRPFSARAETPNAKRRVLLAGLFHQSNAFVGGRTGLEDFEILRGEELWRDETTVHPVAGVLEVAWNRDWEILPVVDMRAMPGATVADAVVDLFWAEFRAVADAQANEGIDGVFLALHGAMVSESLADVEGEILRRIRGVGYLSDAPICGVMDPQANFTEAMARQADGLIACRRNPPTDSREAAKDAALLLDGLMETENRPTTVRDHPPVMWTPGGADTDSGPMLVLEDRAREIEAESPDVLAVNVLAGFPFADMPEAGVGFSAVTTGDLELAHGALRELNVVASSLREEGNRTGIPPEEAMARLEGHDEGPVLLVEPSDNVGAGAPGDNTRLLSVLLDYRVKDAGVVINDPETVALLRSVRLGERQRVIIGGKSGEIGTEPLPLEVEVVSKSDGRFVPEEEPRSSLAAILDDEVDMGSCAVVRYGGILVLLTSRRTPPLDLGQWRSQGVDPEELFAIGIKAAIEHRPAYEPIARASYTINLPGPCAENLKLLPFERVSRPVYPLDAM